MRPLRILLIEDSLTDYEIIDYKVRQADVDLELHRVTRLGEGIARIEQEFFDLVLLELVLPDVQGREAYARLAEAAPELPVVILTGLADTELGIALTRDGAQDYLVKDEIEGRLLARTIRCAIERKRNQVEAESLRRQAEDVQRKRFEFLAMVSHELRNPLTGMVGYAHLLSKTDLDPLQEEYVEALASSSRSLKTLLDNLLDLSSAESGHLQLDPQPTNLRDNLLDSAALMLAGAREKGLEFVTAIDPRLPETVVTDMVKLRQVVVNLLTNAIKFTDQGYVGLSARVRSRAQDVVVVRFVIEDSGRGIAEEKKKAIFLPFTQANSQDRTRGAGLGLAISIHIIQSLGGVFGVESEVGAGSAFWFDLPFPVHQRSTVVRGAAGQKVLVADHLVPAAEAQCFVFQRLGAETVRVENELDLLRELKRNRYDVLVISSEFPADKTDLVGRVPRVLVTDYERRGRTPEGLEYVSRPFRYEDFWSGDEPEEPRAVPTAPGGRILVIDDDPISGHVLRAIAQSQGRVCTLAKSAEQALKFMEQERFNLIILDRHLPDGDGLELAKRWRNSGRVAAEATLVMLSGEGPPTQEELRESGIHTYRMKPIEPDDLSQLLENHGGVPQRIDWSVLERLKRYQKGEVDLARDLVLTFVESCEERTDLLALTEDREDLRRLAHQLRGAASLVGASAVVQAAYALEHLQAPEPHQGAVDRLLDVIEATLDEFRDFLGESVTEGPSNLDAAQA